MVELQVPIAIAAKYATLTVPRSLLCAHQSPFRKRFPKAAISTARAAGHTWLRCPNFSSGFLPTSLLLENLRLSSMPGQSLCHPLTLPYQSFAWALKVAGTISWASYRSCYTAFVKVKMLKICQTESFAFTSFRSVGQGATRVEEWLNITF